MCEEQPLLVVESAAQGAASSSLVPYIIAGSVGGACNTIVGYPMDTIKVRLQIQPRATPGKPALFTGTLDCAVKTVKKEGLLGLYRGMLSPLATATPFFAVCFLGYGLGKQLQQRTPHDQLTLAQHFNAGMLSGIFATTILTPADRVKCLMQIQEMSGKSRKYHIHRVGRRPRPPRYYSNSMECALQLYQEGGVRSLYRGTLITLVKEVPCTGAYFCSYEWVLQILTPPGRSRSEVGLSRVLLAGGVGGVACWLVAIAPDTIKSRVQTAPGTTTYIRTTDIFRKLLKAEGLGALFRGLTPALMRAFPAHAACFLGYEATMRTLHWFPPSL